MNADVPQMNADYMNGLSRKVIGAAQTVSSRLGCGFLEKVYENSLCVELRHRELDFRQQQPLEIRYDGEIVGCYVPDLLVEGSIIVELKCVPAIMQTHRLQCLNYLKATNLRLALLLNFHHPRLEVARVIRTQ